MSLSLDNFYARWRMPEGRENVLHDGKETPSERLLQVIWCHQRLRRDRLRTADGQTVRVLHPGFVSLEGGPDFRGAVIQMGDAAPRSGDIEIDLCVNGWRAHGHDRNPAFQNVLLHVVWKETERVSGVPPSGGNPAGSRLKAGLQTGQPPILSLCDALDAPLAELSRWLENESLRVLPESLRGQCCVALRGLDETRQVELLAAAARVRLQAKAEQFRARARHAGWEQSLWEGLFHALGYKHNVWPMRNLAEGRSRWLVARASCPSDEDKKRTGGTPVPLLILQARLLGLSGLLPAECPSSRGDGAGYVRRLWDCWWREQDEFSDCRLPRAVWKFHGLRPANHPQRRLALAAHWLADKNFISKIENWGVAGILDGQAALPRGLVPQGGISPVILVDSLRKILEVERDDFWSWHWTFQSARLPKAQPLLGDARVTDLAVNVILPWLWIRAAEGGNDKIRQIIEHRHALWPLAEDNSILKLARQRLLGAGRSRALRGAAAQQGLIQITRDFCEHSNAVCAGCRFPELVRDWSAG